jgi:hypothetical protein
MTLLLRQHPAGIPRESATQQHHSSRGGMGFSGSVFGVIVFITAGAIFEFCGDEEWPTAVFLSLLALYSFSVYWRYINQREGFTQNDYLFRVEHKP